MTTFYDTPGQVQYIEGTAEADTFLIAAPSAGYRWAVANDGIGLVVWNGADYDVLHGVESLLFDDLQVDFINGAFFVTPVGEPSPLSFTDVVGQNDFIQGGLSSADAFLIDGRSSDYRWALANDGVGMVVWRGAEFGVLHDVERLVFNDGTVHFSQ